MGSFRSVTRGSMRMWRRGYTIIGSGTIHRLMGVIRRLIRLDLLVEILRFMVMCLIRYLKLISLD